MGNHTNRFCAWLLLLHYLLTGTGAFLIYNSQHSRCLEDSGLTGEVLLKKCDHDSNLQQWVWINQTTLMCAATSRCLWARPGKSAQMLPCDVQDADVVGLKWDCDREKLMCRNTSMLLTVSRQHLVLKPNSKHSGGRSLDEKHICQEKQRFKRASDVSNELEVAEEETGKLAVMTPEEREFLRWFYRTEDPTTWKFVLLGLAFICLLLGFMLLGMGAMANKSRKKIAKYKAVASLIQTSDKVELQGVSSLPVNTTCEESHGVPEGNHVHMTKLDTTELKAGDIVITWKDGNTSCMYPEEEERVEPDPGEESEKTVKKEQEGNQIQEAEEPNQEEKEEEETMEEEKAEAENVEGDEEMEEQKEAAAAEPEGNDEVTTKE